MLKSHLQNILRFPDDKDATGSSSEAATAGNNAGTDANQGGASSDTTSGKTDEKTPSLQDAVQAELAKGDKESESSTDKEKAADESRSKNEQDQKAEGAEADKEEGAEDTTDEEGGADQEDKGPVPYERFHEVTQEREQYKQQAQQFEAKAKNFEQIETYCSEFNITGGQFQKVLKVQALLNTDPAEALKELLPIVDALQGFQGDKLPQDLQEAVSAGKISAEYAKELAQSRAQKEFGNKRLESERQKIEQQNQLRLKQQVTEASTTWERAKRSADPDYKPKANANAPDGKWEDVRDKFTAMLYAVDGEGNPVHPCNSPQEMVALMDKAYQAIHARYTARSKAPTKKVLGSNGSSTNSTSKITSIEGAASMADAVKFALGDK